MNAKRKTYGVSGYMEWVALIECGKATVKVHFSGGSLTGYGVTPAEFTTQNPMTQAIIENSKEFKSGKIFLLREIERAQASSKSLSVVSTPMKETI